MGKSILRFTFSDGCSLICRCATRFGERLKGLLGTHAGDTGETALLLAPCSSVHTWGMAYDLDLLFLGREGNVMAACRDIRPGSLRSRRHAVAVLERPSSDLPWPQAGEMLVLAERVFDHTVSDE